MKSSGVTLLELLAVMIVLITLLTVSIPVFHRFLTEEKAKITVSKLVASLQFARSSAIKQKVSVALCKSVDGEKCGGAWEDGWIVFLDPQKNGRVTKSTFILRSDRISKKNGRLLWFGAQSLDYLRFNPLGSMGAHNGHFIYCAPAGTNLPNYAIIVSLTGRIRVEENRESADCQH